MKTPLVSGRRLVASREYRGQAGIGSANNRAYQVLKQQHQGQDLPLAYGIEAGSG